MNRFNLFVLLSIVCLIVSCEKKKYPPQLASLNRTQAAIGEEITLSGTQFGEATVQMGSQSVTVKSKTDNSLVIIVPRMAVGPTTVRVQNVDGTSDPLPFTVLQPLPQLASVSPGNGLPGTAVTITGDFLDKLKVVRFGTTAATLATGGTDKQISVTVPTGISRGVSKLSVETDGGSAQGDFIVAATPQISGFSPKRVIVGDQLTITGKYLTDGMVLINGQAVDKARTTVQDEQIRTFIPSTASSGRLTVTVFDKLIATSTDSLIIIPPPLVDVNGLSSTEGIEGDKLTLTGRNLRDVTEAYFGNTPATGLKVISDTQLEVNVPKLSESGETTVSVKSKGGETDAAQKFLAILAPASLSLETERTARNKMAVVTGRNLHRITAATIGGKNAAIVARAEGTSLTLTVPADASTGRVTLTNRAGVGTSVRNLMVVLKPVISSFTTKAAVGEWVIIKGDYLLGAWGFFPVLSGVTPVRAEADAKSDEELWLKVPANAQDGPIRIWNESGDYTDTSPFNVVLSPRIESIRSEAGNLEGFAGEKLIITGSNFDGCTVRFEGSGQNAENAEAPTYAKLVVRIPGDARTGKVRLNNAKYSSESSEAFRVIGKPDITDINPNRAKAGQALIIKGSNLKRIDLVRLGGQDITRSAWSENADGTQITLTVPDAAWRGRLYAQNKAGSDEHKGESFVIVRAPVITSVSSMRLPVGGTISIKGDYLYSVGVSFGGKFGSEYIKRDDDAEVVLKIPADAQDGPLHIENIAGAVDRNGFSVARGPQISNLSPNSGRRGSEVTITGNYFDDVTEVKFSNGGSSPAWIISKSNNQMRVQVPDNALSGTICLYGPYGNGCTGSYNVELPVATIDKSRCVPAGLVPGAFITLRGSNFNDVSQVQFANGAVYSSQFYDVKGDEITLKVPAGTSAGDVRIVNQYGTSAGVSFGLLTGGSGLNTGNVSTSTSTLLLSYQSDSCRPNFFLFCYNGKWVKYYIDSNPLSNNPVGACEKGPFYTTETIRSSSFNVYTERNTTVTPAFRQLKLELSTDRTQFTGFVILVAQNGEVFYGNVIKPGQSNAGDIIATSPTSGTIVRLCAFKNEGSTQQISGQACNVCK